MKPYNDDKRFKKGEQTRANILYSAIEFIADHGLKELSSAKLAAASGVSKSTIFHHFKSIDEVLTCTLNLVFDEMLQTIKQEEHQDVEHFLYSLGQFMFHVSESELKFFKTFLSFSHESMFNFTYRETITSFAKQMEHLFRSELSRLAPNSANQETIESIAALLLPMMDGLGFHYLLNNESTKYQQIWELQMKSNLQLLGVSNIRGGG